MTQNEAAKLPAAGNWTFGPRELIGGLLDYAERFADLNDEPSDGTCREAIRKGEIWFDSGSCTVDPALFAIDLVQYVERFAEINAEPDGGNCKRLLACAVSAYGQRADHEATDKGDGADYAVTVELSITANSAEEAAAFALDDLRDLAIGPIYVDVKNLNSGRIDQVSVGHSLTPWERDDIQFPRLLAEIIATQDKLDLDALAKSMDLTIEDVNSLFNRADQAWEATKAQSSQTLV